MKRHLCTVLFFLIFLLFSLPCAHSQYWKVSEGSPMPEAVSNNAVVAATVNEVPFVYSFGGIDATKTGAGIHLRSFRYNTQTDEWQNLPALPDTMGKIGVAASLVGDIIYITGGYHVFPNSDEISSNKVHRFDVINNTFLTDGAPIPLAIDDHVQVVWRDSLIYIVSGWSGNIGSGGNVSNVQIYDPANDSWRVGTAVPENDLYKAFGASGVIIADSIYYYGGAAGFNFGITGILRKGIINPNNPTQIGWIAFNGDPDHLGYRMAATTVEGKPYWLGGAANTYNYNGIAYDSSGGVAPANRSLVFDANSRTWLVDLHNALPMDLRGVGSISDTVKYLVGGMMANQEVSNRTFRLERSRSPVISSSSEIVKMESGFQIFPNPATGGILYLSSSNGDWKGHLSIWDSKGILLVQKEIGKGTSYSLSLQGWESGLYWVSMDHTVRKLIIE